MYLRGNEIKGDFQNPPNFIPPKFRTPLIMPYFNQNAENTLNIIIIIIYCQQSTADNSIKFK